ncbi:unnamed protein product, partial [Ectocarpus sp. 12 AP-2014]
IVQRVNEANTNPPTTQSSITRTANNLRAWYSTNKLTHRKATIALHTKQARREGQARDALDFYTPHVAAKRMTRIQLEIPTSISQMNVVHHLFGFPVDPAKTTDKDV